MTQIAFTGDVAVTKHFSNSYKDEHLLSEKILNFLSSSDYTVVNVERAVSSGSMRSTEYHLYMRLCRFYAITQLLINHC